MAKFQETYLTFHPEAPAQPTSQASQVGLTLAEDRGSKYRSRSCLGNHTNQGSSYVPYSLATQ